MSERNALFKKVVEILKNDGTPLDEAAKLAHESIVKTRQFLPLPGQGGPGKDTSNPVDSEKVLFRKPGGQSQYSSTIPIVESICKGTPIDCRDELYNPFRRINGTCNNLGGMFKKILE